MIRPYSHSLSDDEKCSTRRRTSAPRKRSAIRSSRLAEFLKERRARDRRGELGDRQGRRRARSTTRPPTPRQGAEKPAPETATLYVYSPDVDPTSSDRVRPSAAPEGKPDTMVAAINRTLKDEMARDPRIVVFGEDVADAAARRRSHGARARAASSRSRTACSGVRRRPRVQLAARRGEHHRPRDRHGDAGIKPVVEIQFFDYIWPAMMQMRDELSMLRYRSNNAFSCPMVIRVADRRLPARRRAVPQPVGREHLRALPGHPRRVPVERAGRRGPAAHGDPLRRPGALPRAQAPLSPDLQQGRVYPGPDYMIPFGKRAVRARGHGRRGDHLGRARAASLLAAQQAEKDGISVMVIDLRTIMPYDWEAIAEAVRRPTASSIAHEDQLTCGFGAELAARIADELFEHLDAPVRRVAALDTPVAAIARTSALRPRGCPAPRWYRASASAALPVETLRAVAALPAHRRRASSTSCCHRPPRATTSSSIGARTPCSALPPDTVQSVGSSSRSAPNRVAPRPIGVRSRPATKPSSSPTRRRGSRACRSSSITGSTVGGSIPGPGAAASRARGPRAERVGRLDYTGKIGLREPAGARSADRRVCARRPPAPDVRRPAKTGHEQDQACIWR